MLNAEFWILNPVFAASKTGSLIAAFGAGNQGVENR
jgi:hypothetical protein